MRSLVARELNLLWRYSRHIACKLFSVFLNVVLFQLKISIGQCISQLKLCTDGMPILYEPFRLIMFKMCFFYGTGIHRFHRTACIQYLTRVPGISVSVYLQFLSFRCVGDFSFSVNNAAAFSLAYFLQLCINHF